MASGKVMAGDTILGVRPDGERITISLQVGCPVRVTNTEGVEEWACPISLEPLHPRLHDAHGGTSLQSLCLALSLVLDLLSKFVEDGGKLIHDDGTEYALSPLAFGYAVRAGKADR